MCLRQLDTSLYRPKYGYKVFVDSANGLYGEFYGCKTRPLGKWLRAKDFSVGQPKQFLHDWLGKEYKNGWHCFYTLRDARSWATPISRIREVP